VHEIWTLYDDLKSYRQHPSPPRRAALAAELDRIVALTNGFVTLDRLLGRLHANKTEPLMVLERPKYRCLPTQQKTISAARFTKRKVSGGTRGDVGRDCRDTFLGLAKTCAKLGIAFWDYLGARLDIPGSPAIPHTYPNSSPLSAARPDRHNFCPSYLSLII
jgi:hypothetical protein